MLISGLPFYYGFLGVGAGVGGGLGCGVTTGGGSFGGGFLGPSFCANDPTHTLVKIVVSIIALCKIFLISLVSSLSINALGERGKACVSTVS